MILYKLEWGAGSLYVGAYSITEAVALAKLRGYGSDPLRVLTCDTNLVVAQSNSDDTSAERSEP